MTQQTVQGFKHLPSCLFTYYWSPEHIDAVLQALARMGASVTGIEPQQDNIKAAVAHAQGDPMVAARTKYLALTAEELAASGMTSLKPAFCVRLQEGFAC